MQALTRLTLTSCLALVQIGPSLAQEKAAPPKFTAGTELVRVDFVVSDKAGRIVSGVTAKDCIVKEDGKERPVVSFEAFDGDAAPSAPLDPSGTAEAPGRRLIRSSTVLLVDDVHLSAEQIGVVRPAIKNLLTSVAGHSDLLAVVAPASKVTVAGELPGTGPELAAAIDRIVGQRPEDNSELPVLDAEAIAILRYDPPTLQRVAARFVALNPTLTPEQAATIAVSRAGDVNFAARRRRETLYATATQSLGWLSDKPGRHSVIIVSGGFAKDPGEPAYNELVTRSLKVNAPLHFVDARGLSGYSRFKGVEYGTLLRRGADEGPTGRSDAVEGSVDLADDSGGVIIQNTNDFEKGLARVLDTMRTYYVIGYEALPHAKQGFHKIEVQVRTKGLNVRARRGYYDVTPGSR
jgi:VWFA-related protein